MAVFIRFISVLYDLEMSSLDDEILEEGISLYRKGEFSASLSKFKTVLSSIEYLRKDSEYKDRMEPLRCLEIRCRLNAAQAAIKSREFSDALFILEPALVLEPASLKGLFRKAVALRGLCREEEALTTLKSLENDSEARMLRKAIERDILDRNKAFKEVWKGKFLSKTEAQNKPGWFQFVSEICCKKRRL